MLFRKIKFNKIDNAMNGLSWMLLHEKKPATYRIDLIATSKMDYSIESLQELDNYLDTIRKDEDLDNELYRIVLRVGAYTGEVIKNNAPIELNWYDYDTAIKIDPRLTSFGAQLGVKAVLSDGKSTFHFPLAKVIKFIENGREDGLEYYAKALCSESFNKNSH